MFYQPNLPEEHGRIRRVPQSSEDLQPDSVHGAANTVSDESRIEEAKPELGPQAEPQTKEEKAKEDRHLRTVPRPTGPREPPAPSAVGGDPPPTGLRESYGAIADILNMYHFRDSFHERYIPRDNRRENANRHQNRQSEVPVSRFDWSSSESGDGRGRGFFKEQKKAWRKRVGHLTERLKNQGTKIAWSIRSAGMAFKGIRRRRS